MENNKNLEELTKEASRLLLDCNYLLEIFAEIMEGAGKEGLLIGLLQKDIKAAFHYIEQTRCLISKPN